jgi:hypothetical protein
VSEGYLPRLFALSLLLNAIQVVVILVLVVHTR